MIGNVSSVANSYISMAAARVAGIASLLGKQGEATTYSGISAAILSTLLRDLYNATTGAFASSWHNVINSMRFWRWDTLSLSRDLLPVFGCFGALSA